MSEIDAIVLDIDGGAMLEQCVESLLRQTVATRIIVVDNGSVIPASERLSGESIVHVRHDRNLGFTGGVNAGFLKVNAPFVALINNDVILERECLARLHSLLLRSPQVAATQPIVISPGGSIDGAGIVLTGGRFLQLGHGNDRESVAVEPAAWGISATAALYRTAALRQCSLDDGSILHPQFFAYYEDVELSARLRRAGWQLEVVREPLAVHSGSASAPKLGIRGDYLRVRNRYFVSRLHPGVGSRRALLSEDLRRVARLIISADAAAVGSTLKGIGDGLTQRLQ